MGSSIRSIRDQRGVSVRSERRDNTNGEPSKQKTYDAKFTGHNWSNEPPLGTRSEYLDTGHQVDHVHELLRETLAPRIQSKSAIAASVDRRYFYYYQRKKSGRRCSCYEVETSPDNQCPVCLGTGIVVGFEKHGTITEILDFTSPNLVMVNVEPNFDMDTRPIYFRLMNDARSGYVEAELPIRANVGVIDTYMLFQPIFNRGVSVIATDPLGGTAQIKEGKDLEPFLSFNRVKIRLEFTKMDERPLVSHFMMRYKIQQDTRIFGDHARAEESLGNANYGNFDTYQEIPIFFDGLTIKNFESEDILYRLEDGRRFKITAVTKNIIAGTLTSTDVRARFALPSIDLNFHNILI